MTPQVSHRAILTHAAALATPAPARLLTINETITTMGCGRTHLYHLIAQGVIPAVKLGRRTMVRADSLHDYIASLPPAKITTGQNRAA